MVVETRKTRKTRKMTAAFHIKETTTISTILSAVFVIYMDFSAVEDGEHERDR
jgi:hypothetical protein